MGDDSASYHLLAAVEYQGLARRLRWQSLFKCKSRALVGHREPSFFSRRKGARSAFEFNVRIFLWFPRHEPKIREMDRRRLLFSLLFDDQLILFSIFFDDLEWD